MSVYWDGSPNLPQKLMLVLMLFNVVINDVINITNDLESRLNKTLITYRVCTKLVPNTEEKGIIQTDLKRLNILKEHVLKVRYASGNRNGSKYISEKENVNLSYSERESPGVKTKI